MFRREKAHVKVMILVLTAVLGVAGAAVPAAAQSRPLATEDPETVPAGHVLLEGGLDFGHGSGIPFTGVSGNLWRIGVLGASIGVGPVAELQVDWGLRQRMTVDAVDPDAPFAPLVRISGDSTSDAVDLRVGTKLRLASETEGRPAIAGRFWTNLPVADVESGLGMGGAEFHAGVAVGKTVRSVRLVVNFGLASVDDAFEAPERHVIVDYGGSLARAVRTGLEVVGELAGRTSRDAPGAPPASTMFRIGGRATHGPVRVDAGLALGLGEFDPVWGFTVGATWVFRAFDTP
jgi:hypothetical protein